MKVIVELRLHIPIKTTVSLKLFGKVCRRIGRKIFYQFCAIFLLVDWTAVGNNLHLKRKPIDCPMYLYKFRRREKKSRCSFYITKRT